MNSKFNWLAAFIVIAFLVGMVPWIDGLLYKREYFKTIAILNTSTGSDYQVLDYQVGWLNSHAKLSIKSKNINNQNSDFSKKMSITIDQDITHGPVVYDPMSQHWALAYVLIQSRCHFEPIETLLGFPKEQGIAQITTLVTFNRDYINQLQSPAISGEIPGVGKYVWNGYKGNSVFRFVNGNLDHIKSSGSIGNLQFQKDLDKFTIENFSGQSEMQYISQYRLWDGNQETTVGKISYTTNGKTNVEMQAFKLLASLDLEQNKFYNFAMNIGFDKLIIPDAITLSPANIKITFSHFDAAAWSNLAKTFIQGAPQDSDFMRIITPSTSVAGDVNVNTSMGHFLLSFKMPNDASINSMKNNSRVLIRVAVPLANYLVDKMDQSGAMGMMPMNHAMPSENYSNDPEQVIGQQSVSQSGMPSEQATVQQSASPSNMPLQVKQPVSLESNAPQQAMQQPASPQPSASQQMMMQQAASPQSSAPQSTMQQMASSPQPNMQEQVMQQPPVSQSSDAPEMMMQQQTAPQSAKDQLNQWIQQGYVIQDKGDYVMDIIDKQGKVTINGKEFVMTPPIPPPPSSMIPVTQ